jgi:hypothetical protein
LPETQLALPFEAGAGQAVHRVPQVAGAVSDEQMPLQLCSPARHIPLQARLLAMQAPLHTYWPAGHWVPHDRPSHVAEPPVGTAHAAHDVVPQLEVRLLATHGPVFAGQRW